MALTVISGRAKSGKSKYIYDRIRELSENGGEVMLIVPEQYTHAAEKKLLGVVGAIEDNKIEVFSFARLAYATDKRLGYPFCEKIDSVGKALTVEQIIKNNNMEFFKNVTVQNGFLDLITGTIDEFKKYLIMPETLSDTAEKSDNEVLAMKLRDLGLIYGEYEKAICRKYADSSDALTILAQRLSQSDIYKSKHVFFDEFSTFVPQEISVIKELVKMCAEVSVALCCDASDKNPALFMPTLDTVSTLKRNLTDNVSLKKIEGTHFESNDLKYLEQNLYRFPARTFEGKCENVHVFSANNPCSETERTAVEIISLARDMGYRYRDIGIICSDTGVYARHIERIFGEYGIPYFIDEKTDVLNHHIIRYVMGLVEVYTRDYSYESIFNFLKAAFTDANPEHICILEKFILKTKIRRSSWLNDEKWTEITDNFYGENKGAKDAVNSIREDYIIPLAQMHEKIKGRRTVADDVTALYELMVKFKLPDTISRYIEYFKNENEVRLSKEYEQIWEVLINTLDEIAYICGDRTVSPDEFLNLLYTAFSQQSIGSIPSTADRVIVGNTERTRLDGLKVLFVLGVNEGVFPVAPKSGGVLDDRDKENLKELGVEFSTTSAVAAYYSQFAVYTAFTMPSEMLFISYPKAGNDFKTLRRSYIIPRVCTLLGISEECESTFSDDDKNRLNSPVVCREYLSAAVSHYASCGSENGIWKNVYNYYRDNTDFIPRLEKFLASDNIAHRLSEKNLERLVGIMSHTSVSKIQRYMACRYSFFMDYILKVEKPKDDVIDSIDIGNITHSVLERICKGISSEGIKFDEADDNRVSDAIDSMLSEYLNAISRFTDDFTSREQYIIKRLKNSIFLCFKAIQRHISESMFEPIGYEMEFSEDSALGCIKIETQNGKTVSLTGKIDRADAYKTKDGTYIRVIDYKTGSKTFKLDDIFYGLDVQLAVYLNALVKSDSSYKHGGALYFLIDDPVIKAQKRISDEKLKNQLEAALKLKGMIVKDDTVLAGYDDKTAAIRNKFELDKFKLMDDYLKKLLSDVCTDMTNGDISINPYKKGNNSPCSYCKYLSVCRFDSSDKNNSYNYLESLGKADEIWQRMEAKLDVDSKSANSD